MDDKRLTVLLSMYGSGSRRWSVLFIDVHQDRVESLVTVVEACGLVTTTVLRDPDKDDVFMVQLSETRTHDAESLRARTLEMEEHARAHDAAVADWSARNESD